MGHRTFLPLTHPNRKRKNDFDGTIETRVARFPLTGKEVFERVKDIDVVLGKLYKKPTPNSIWKKRSIFWDLPYWEHLQVRHCLDFMHIEKNVCESIIGTLLNIPSKTKDGMKARLDLQELGVRAELAPQQSGKRAYLPPACYTLSRKEKISFCECLSSVKVPSGYSSNPKNLLSMKDLKLLGLKSHDCHVLMQHLLPVAIRGIMPRHVRVVIMKLCFFFNVICSKVIDPLTLDKLQADIIVTLCEFEMYFLYSFFDIIVHLVTHLVREIKICGPLYVRQMYPFERFLCILKAYVRNRHHPEASIVEAFSTEFERGNSITSQDVKKSYYGVIEEIWEIDYKDFKVALFKCKLFDIRRGVRVDESGFTLVDFNRFGHEDDPFILATQVKQVFYIRDPADVRWSIVLQGKRRIIGVDNVEDEEEYNQFDENPPFSIGLQTTSIEDSTDISYARNDHDEGVWIDHQ
ncbi:uncharacterized protein LOC141665458 [Apium graveolens]|uniref:uncharacterized protein LOC141665458 n=1 Tax=Apium graveolens TaxID=4045 RepID=UPI003D7A71A6